MKAAVIVPNGYARVSGGHRGLHLISKTLMDLGVDACTIGMPYVHDDVGDRIVSYLEASVDKDTVLIYPEGYSEGPVSPDYMRWLEDYEHGPVVVYVQNYKMVDPYRPWETHFWSLGPTHRDLVRESMGIPDSIPIEELLLPVDPFWTPTRTREKIKGSVLYCPRKNGPVLDRIGRACGSRPVFRVTGATKYELHEFLDMADIVVLASDSEGQSCFANEAMRMECAVVTWPSGGLPDIIQHEKTGLLVRQNDVVGLEDCVKRLQQNRELSRKIGERASEWVAENLSMQGFRSKLKALWEKITA